MIIRRSHNKQIQEFSAFTSLATHVQEHTRVYYIIYLMDACIYALVHV